ncbi:MAG: MFS transporter [Candidatus Omnitrophota bacterium]
MKRGNIFLTHISRLTFILRALRYRNYRLFFFGQGVSLVGSWMQLVTVSWLVYRLTSSAFLLGVVAFASQVPAFIFSPFAGVLADRFNRKAILMITQALAMVQAAILAYLALFGIIRVWQIITLSLAAGLINAFDAPVRQAFVLDMVEDKKDLGNAIALNSLIFNSAKLIGSSLAGVLLVFINEGVCFLINAISFLAVIIALAAMKIKIGYRVHARSRVLDELRDGFVYVGRHVPIRSILLLVTVLSLLGMSYMVLMPVIAKNILGGGAQTLGFLIGSIGLGALVGALYLASRTQLAGLQDIIFWASVVFGAALVAFSFSRVFWISFFLMAIAGFSMIAQMVASNTLLQNLSEYSKRGRVLSFYTTAFMGMMPFGSLFAGACAAKIGAPITLCISGLLCVIAALFFGTKRKVLTAAIETVRKEEEPAPFLVP